MTNTRTFLDIHVIQTVPPSNINRDDTGSPKTAVYGGVRRARVSSQAWKRATRKSFEATLDQSDLGERTKRVVELVAERVTQQAPALEERALQIAEAVLKAGDIKLSAPRKGETLESGYLLFLSNLQVDSLAAAGIAAERDGALGALDKKAIRAVVKAQNSIDLALFGRMVADVSNLNVDASAQVAHALSVHAVDNEFDYFTAVDDRKEAAADEDAGAGMIGTVEFNSSTLYRYATVDVTGLLTNLGSVEATERAVGAFVTSFVTSMPTGKQNTFANRTLPDAVVVLAREDQPVSLVGAFEEPVEHEAGHSRVTAATERLATHSADVTAAYGTGPVQSWTTGVGGRVAAIDSIAPRVSFDTLVDEVRSFVTSRLTDPARA